jgi:uroporphyrinogen decarboxylase
VLEGYLHAGQGLFDMIELPGDDYASNENLIISPAMFRQFIKPCITRMVETIRAIQPEIKIMLHSDGAVQKIIPDFIELGIDVLHPLEPVSGMDVRAVKAAFGGQIAFIGGVDISHAMPGTLKEVREDVDRCLRDLAPGGGYVLAPCNHLQADVPAENVIELFKYARESGVY